MKKITVLLIALFALNAHAQGTTMQERHTQEMAGNLGLVQIACPEEFTELEDVADDSACFEAPLMWSQAMFVQSWDLYFDWNFGDSPHVTDAPTPVASWSREEEILTRVFYFTYDPGEYYYVLYSHELRLVVVFWDY